MHCDIYKNDISKLRLGPNGIIFQDQKSASVMDIWHTLELFPHMLASLHSLTFNEFLVSKNSRANFIGNGGECLVKVQRGLGVKTIEISSKRKTSKIKASSYTYPEKALQLDLAFADMVFKSTLLSPDTLFEGIDLETFANKEKNAIPASRFLEVVSYLSSDIVNYPVLFDNANYVISPLVDIVPVVTMHASAERLHYYPRQ